jgi:hypothetical protein
MSKHLDRALEAIDAGLAEPSPFEVVAEAVYDPGTDTLTPSTTTADNQTVTEGDWVFDFYDGHWGFVGIIGDDGWFTHHRAEGGTGNLNGERVCVKIPSTSPWFDSHGGPDDYTEWTTEALRDEHRRLSTLKAWSPVTLIERELRRRDPVRLAQDAYYSGTAADVEPHGEV